MKALKDNCAMTKLDVDLLKENNGTLKSFFENNRVIALFDIPDGCAGNFSDPFKILNKSLLYSRFFSEVTVGGNASFSMYITTSLLNNGNIIKLLNDYYVYDGVSFMKAEEPELLRPYIEGTFGYRTVQVGSSSVPIEKCYPKVISAHDAHYHLVHEKENTTVQIVSELPARYSVEKYYSNLKEIGGIIMPQSLGVEVSMSSTVKKAVR